MRIISLLSSFILLMTTWTFSQNNQNEGTRAEAKIIVEIWSDVVCPFCYMGKTNFDRALNQFEHKDEVKVIWRSFQLDPSLPKGINESYENYLIQKKGWTKAQIKSAFNDISKEGKKIGLKYNFDLLKIANSYNAHLLIQYAKELGKGTEIKEALFKGYFTEGIHLGDMEQLVKVGVSIGLNEQYIREAMKSINYSIAIEKDMKRAKEINVSSVPFFLFNGKTVVLGAQPEEAFLETLKSTYDQK